MMHVRSTSADLRRTRLDMDMDMDMDMAVDKDIGNIGRSICSTVYGLRQIPHGQFRIHSGIYIAWHCIALALATRDMITLFLCLVW